jgi:methionyl-tRNA formyltransferase
MRLLLMADNKVGGQITKWLLNNYRADLAAVISTSDNNLLKLAKDNGIPADIYVSSEQVCKFLDNNGIEPNLGILAWWPSIIKEPLISKPENGFVNTHPSYLPYNRGKHYNFWALVEQAPFGVTLHVVNGSVDSGSIIAQERIEYGWEDNGETLHRKALEEMLKLFKKTYPELRKFNFIKNEQDNKIGSFHLAKEIDEASKIDLNKEYKARDLLNLLRARTFEGHPACWFEDGKKYEVRINIRKIENE